MRVFRGVPKRAIDSVALTIGNFDGIHLGHQAMLTRLIEVARARGLPAAVMTFEPHPREFFTPAAAPTRLTSLREKLELLLIAGIDRVYVCRFNRTFSQIAADEFVTRILRDGLAVKWLLGEYALLQRHAPFAGFELCALESVESGGKRVSSTLVREALAAGDMDLAASYLARPYSISGRVMHGDKIGRTLGFPTANVRFRHNRPPVAGIFAVKFHVADGPTLNGVASLGTRPTVTAHGGFRLEVHVFNFSGDLYGRHVRVDFLMKLRDEAHYPDLETMTAQIARDAQDARRFFDLPLRD